MTENDQLRIENYLYGQMTEEQALDFEKEISENKTLAEALKLEQMEQQTLKLLEQDRLRNAMAEWKLEKEESPGESGKVRRLARPRLFYRLAAAASVLLLLGTPFWWANQQYSDSALANSTLGVRTSFTDRSNILDSNPLLPALIALQENDLATAETALKRVEGTPYWEEAQLLLGEIYTNRADYAAAETLYNQLVTTSGEIIIRQKAEWLLGNVWLAKGEGEKARAAIAAIAEDGNHLRNREAVDLLGKLDSFWRYFVW